MSDLGLFKTHGWLIIFACIMFYSAWYVYLSREYGPIDE